ncbi:hypothetical protein B9Z55_013603 [Caenorhabditis nigoni]|uniref:Uncharacterized protein n=1 Tax=Caenorhabditis nigoni TaxID=1611254 RepID=A0A2G5U2N2_9PELO|nr:hypothetical protein B9Z55_013603 [Caenorhabditis nigoni]
MHIAYLLCSLFLLTAVTPLSRHPKLLLISFDGFRYDLLKEGLVPNIHKWATMSTWFTSGVKSQYVTYTAPNHMSIATGMYEEEHGIVGNYFFDSQTKKMFDYFNSTGKEGAVNASQADFWYNADPIWLTNERWESSRRSASFYWPNGESPFPYLPHKPKVAKPWTIVGDLKSWMQDADDVIDAFTREKEPVNFLAWYVAEPDHTLHGNGFHNKEIEKTLKQLDDLFLYFIKKFDDNNLGSDVNIILTADHGHAEIQDHKHVMCVKNFVSGAGFEMGDHMIYPHSEGIGKQIYANLTEAVKKHGYDVNIHWKEDVPERWHYKNNSRIGKIVFEPKIGSAISFSCTMEQMEKQYGENGTTKFNSSTHGQDPDRPEMRAFLMMRGPAFSENFTIADIPSNVDLYNLMCHVLGITPTENNGTMEIVKRALKENRYMPMTHGFVFNQITDSWSFSLILIPSMCIVIAFFAYGCKNTVMKSDPNWGRSDNVQGYRPLSNRTNEGFELNDDDDDDEGDGLRANLDLERGARRPQAGGGALGSLSNGTVAMSGLLDEMSDDDI